MSIDIPGGERAHSVDLDDVIFDRGLYVRTIALLAGLFKKLKSEENLQIPSISHETSKGLIINPLEYFSYIVHARRELAFGAKSKLMNYYYEGEDIYGNTGRSDKEPWVRMTEQSLTDKKIYELFQGIFYTPQGISTALSKAAALKLLQEHYKHVEHDEDDPRTAMILGHLLPGITINLIEYTSTGLLMPKKLIDSQHNIRRVKYR